MNSISNPVPHVLRVADLRAHSNDALLEATQNLAQNERRITLEILHHLREIERRRAFAKLGHASLWEYAMKELNYSESSAYRRISAMRALNEHPELEEKIQEGKITVTTVSQVQTFLKAEQYQANKVYSADAKRELFAKCAGKSGRDVTRELITLSPLGFRVQKERVLSEDRTQISFVADPVLLGKLHRVRDLSASRLKDAGSYPELMELMSEVTLDKIDPLRRPAKKVGKTPPENSPGGGDGGVGAGIHGNKEVGCGDGVESGTTNESVMTNESGTTNESVSAMGLISDQNVAHTLPQPTDKSGYSLHEETSGVKAQMDAVSTQGGTVSAQSSLRSTRPHISAALRSRVWKESGGRCTYANLTTGAKCTSTFGLEIEHCKPHGLGGSTKGPENLRLLCKAHNQWNAIQTYGLSKMKPYLEPRSFEPRSCEPRSFKPPKPL